MKGPFTVGGTPVTDGYFASSGYLLDDDSLTGSGNTTEYSFVDAAAAGPSATVPFTLRVEYENGHDDVAAGQAILTHKGEWIRYSTLEEGAEYVAICLPAFSPDTVNRDEE